MFKVLVPYSVVMWIRVMSWFLIVLDYIRVRSKALEQMTAKERDRLWWSICQCLLFKQFEFTVCCRYHMGTRRILTDDHPNLIALPTYSLLNYQTKWNPRLARFAGEFNFNFITYLSLPSLQHPSECSFFAPAHCFWTSSVKLTSVDRFCGHIDCKQTATVSFRIIFHYWMPEYCKYLQYIQDNMRNNY